MLRIYISHARADRAHLDRFLTWFKPLEQKYFLRVWHDHPLPNPKPWPGPGKFVYGARKPPNPPPQHHPDLEKQLASAHVFVFLVSHRSMATAHVEGTEIPVAVGRLVSEGGRFLKIVTVPITLSNWKEHSKLGGFKPSPSIIDDEREAISMPPEFQRIENIDFFPGAGWPPQPADENEDAWRTLTNELETMIAELRKDLLDEARKNNQPTADFFRPEKKEAPEPDVRETPLGVVFAWAAVLAVFYVLFKMMSAVSELGSPGGRVAFDSF